MLAGVPGGALQQLVGGLIAVVSGHGLCKHIGLGRSVKKGKKMAGQWGNVRKTSCNLKLVGVDRENNVLLIKGNVPGPSGAVVFVKKSTTKG